MAKIPFQTQQQVGVGTPQNPRMSAEAAQAPFKALAGVGQAVVGAGRQIGEYQAQKKQAIEKADTVRFQAEMDARTGAFRESTANITDPEELKQAYEAWQSDTQEWYGDSTYSQQYGEKLNPYFEGTLIRQSGAYLGVNGEGGKYGLLQIEQAQEPWKLSIQEGAKGNDLIDLTTGNVVMTAEERIIAAQVELGKLSPVWNGASGKVKVDGIIAGVNMDDSLKSLEIIEQKVASNELHWKEAVAQADAIIKDADENEFYLAGQRRSVKDRARGVIKSVKVGAHIAADGFMGEIFSFTAKGKDASAQIDVNGEFVEGVYGKGVVESMTRLNTAPLLAEIFGDAAMSKETRKQVEKKLNKTRKDFYGRIDDVTGWVTKGKSKTSAQNAIVEISKSNLPAEEQAVMMQWVISENSPTFDERNENMRATPSRFRNLLTSYNEAVAGSGNEDLYTEFMPDWAEITEYSKTHTDIETGEFTEEKIKKVTNEAETQRVQDTNALKLTGRARSAVLGGARPQAGLTPEEIWEQLNAK
jgi:hypothetical protein